MSVTHRTRRKAMRLFRLCLTDTLLDEDRVRQVVRQVAEAGRRDRFAILSHFRRLLRLYLAEHTAAVESATALPQDLRLDLMAQLTHVYGSNLTASFTARPALIGGMRITVGSDVYDGTIQNELASLEAGF